MCRLYTLFEDVFNAQNDLEYGFSFGTQLLASLTRNESFHDVLEGLPLLEGVNECANKLVNGDTQLNDKLYNTDNAGNNTKGGCVGTSIRLADSGLGSCNLTACVSALDGGQVAQCALDAAITAVGGSRLRITSNRQEHALGGTELV